MKASRTDRVPAQKASLLLKDSIGTTRYYMEKPRGQEDSQVYRQDREGEEEEIEGLESYGPQEMTLDDRKMEELQTSLDRLKAFVRSLQGEPEAPVPPCVEDHCGPSLKKRLRSGQEAIQLTERRVNKMLRNRKIKKNWNGQDITLLVWLVCRLMHLQGVPHVAHLEKQHWQKIAGMIPGSSWQTCKFRWLSLKKFKLVTHKWSEDESKLLSDIISQTSILNWKEIAQRLYEANPLQTKVFRTGKQCREHWNCFLNPSILKGPWSTAEDRKLLEYVLELEGSKKWSEIAKYMEGRTENALKNRFNLLMIRQRKDSGNLTEKRLIRLSLNRLMLEEGQPHRNLPGTIAPMNQEPQDEAEEVPGVGVGFQERLPNRSQPIVPSVVPQAHIALADIQFGNLYQGFYGYVGTGNGSSGSTSPDASRGIYFTYVFPNRMA